MYCKENMALNKKYQDQLLKIIHPYIPKCTIYLFGSRAQDTEKAGSDVDIAIDAGSIIKHKIILNILNDIDDTTIPMKVDIIDLQNVKENFKKEVLSQGIIIWKN